MKQTAEYGFWKSPITSDLVAAESVRLGEPRIESGSVYWLEGRPAEHGRTALVQLEPDGSARDVLPAPWNVRTRVHEYGGGAYTVRGRTSYFSENKDLRLYRARAEEPPDPLTPEGPTRYADLELDSHRNILLAVCEDHANATGEPVQSIVAIPLGEPSGPVRALATGADFYSNPRVSPNGARVCWLEWRHPNMPWDGTELWTAEIAADGGLESRHKVAGGSGESVFQPQWSPEGELHFVSDRNGFWNLYRHEPGRIVPLHEREAEFGLPQWVFGMSTYGFLGDGRILCAYCEAGSWGLGLLDRGGALHPLATSYNQIDGVTVCGETAVFRAASSTEPPAIVRLDSKSGRFDVLRHSTVLDASLRQYLSTPRSVSIPREDGQIVHTLYYGPRNPDYVAPPDEQPPLIVRVHGGPTGAASGALSLATQFWTSRGFAFVDVNYGGSTGYGRKYRERLNGQWGVVDVEDAVSAARYFADQGLVDPDRLIVKGGSAGGYTVLCCLAFRNEFAAGASYYGISDLVAMARGTHKFESRYHETLVGPWPAAEDLYIERSPLRAADQLTAPVIFFQGADDRVVPPQQTEAMVRALRARGAPVAYFLFEGEAHGFRDAVHLKRALDGELYYYGAMLLRKGLRF